MKWKKIGIPNLEIGGSPVPLRTLRLKDKLSDEHRYRIFTVREGDFSSSSLLRQPKGRSRSSLPAWGQLARDEAGRIGVIVRGAHSGMIRIGRREELHSHIFVPFSALSKRARKRLLIPLDYQVCQEDDLFLVKEKRKQPFYVASRMAKKFHFPGCCRAQRIKEENLIIFDTREEAFQSGYSPAKFCRP